MVTPAGCRGRYRVLRSCVASVVVGFLYGALQPHLDQMQHTPVDDPARYRFHEFGMANAPKEIREVGIDDFPVSAKQQFFDLDRRLLGVPPRPVGVLFGWKFGVKDRFQNQRCRRHADPIPHARDAWQPELAVGVRYEHAAGEAWRRRNV